jgi:hypothetical protein
MGTEKANLSETLSGFSKQGGWRRTVVPFVKLLYLAPQLSDGTRSTLVGC